MTDQSPATGASLTSRGKIVEIDSLANPDRLRKLGSGHLD
jgi:hypothetical protein